MIVKAKADVEAKEKITTLSTSKNGEKLTLQISLWGLQLLGWSISNRHFWNLELQALERYRQKTAMVFNSCMNKVTRLTPSNQCSWSIKIRVSMILKMSQRNLEV